MFSRSGFLKEIPNKLRMRGLFQWGKFENKFEHVYLPISLTCVLSKEAKVIIIFYFKVSSPC